MKLELTRRSILVAVVAVGIVAAGAGAGTMALFSSQASSTNNTIQAGTLDLSTNSSTGFEMNGNLKPTASQAGTAKLSNGGSLPGQVKLQTTYTQSDRSDATKPNMSANQTANVLTVSNLTYGGTSILNNVTDTNGDGNITLGDLRNQTVYVGSLGANSNENFHINLTMQNVGNDYQGDGVNATFHFTVQQNT